MAVIFVAVCAGGLAWLWFKVATKDERKEIIKHWRGEP
jgi:hypothetical protein